MVYERQYASLKERTGKHRDYAEISGRKFSPHQHSSFKFPGRRDWYGVASSAFSDAIEKNKGLRYLAKAYPFGRSKYSVRHPRANFRLFAHANSKFFYRLFWGSVNLWFMCKYVFPILNTQTRFEDSYQYRWSRHNEMMDKNEKYAQNLKDIAAIAPNPPHRDYPNKF